MSTYILPRYPNPAHLSANGTPSGTTVLTGEGWEEIDTLTGIGGGATTTKSWYSAATSGGAVNVLNTQVFVSGILISWTQTVPTGTNGQWDFTDPDQSSEMLTAGII